MGLTIHQEKTKFLAGTQIKYNDSNKISDIFKIDDIRDGPPSHRVISVERDLRDQGVNRWQSIALNGVRWKKPPKTVLKVCKGEALDLLRKLPSEISDVITDDVLDDV
ncbi:hypothetical protein TNCV_154101 [Trichonephila clavipes]|nr:hypothetical protein TNCV_154101 [Trichonephila clavipes]